MNKVTPFLMFSGKLEAATELYTSTFPDSRVEKSAVGGSGKDGPLESATFTVGGQVLPLVADRAEALHAAPRRSQPAQGEGRRRRDDADEEARRRDARSCRDLRFVAAT